MSEPQSGQSELERATKFVKTYVWPRLPISQVSEAYKNEVIKMLTSILIAERQATLASVIAKLRKLPDDIIERYAKAVFMRDRVYGGYDDETKEREWQRCRNLEISHTRALSQALADWLAANPDMIR